MANNSISKLLSQEHLEMIASYTDQLYDGNSSEQVSAAIALGNLPAFLPTKLQCEALKVAEERAVWENLIYQTKQASQKNVREACLVGLTSLLLHPYGGTSISHKTSLKRMKMELVSQEFLETIGATISPPCAVRTIMMAARLLAALAPSLNVANEWQILGSEKVLPSLFKASTFIATEPRGSGCRAATTLAVSCISLAACTPNIAKAVMKNARPLESLATVYAQVINPEADSATLMAADIIAMMLKVLSADAPRCAVGYITPASWARVLRNAFVASQAPECFSSYVAVESGNIRVSTSEATAEVTEWLEDLLERDARAQEDARTMIVQLGDILENNNNEINEIYRAAEQGGYSPDGPRLEAKEFEAEDIKLRILDLEETLAACEYRSEVVGQYRTQLDGGSGPLSRSRVKRNPPKLNVLSEVLRVIPSMCMPPEATGPVLEPDRDVTPDLSHLHGKLLGGGLLRAALKLFEAGIELRRVVGACASLVIDLGLLTRMSRLVSTARRLLTEEVKRLDAVLGRLDARLAELKTEGSVVERAVANAGRGVTPLEKIVAQVKSGPTPPVTLTQRNAASTLVSPSDLMSRHAAVLSESSQVIATREEAATLMGELQNRVEVLTLKNKDLKEAGDKVKKALKQLGFTAMESQAPLDEGNLRMSNKDSKDIPFDDDAHPINKLVSSLLSCFEQAAFPPPLGSDALVSVLEGSVPRDAAPITPFSGPRRPLSAGSRLDGTPTTSPRSPISPQIRPRTGMSPRRRIWSAASSPSSPPILPKANSFGRTGWKPSPLLEEVSNVIASVRGSLVMSSGPESTSQTTSNGSPTQAPPSITAPTGAVDALAAQCGSLSRLLNSFTVLLRSARDLQRGAVRLPTSVIWGDMQLAELSAGLVALIRMYAVMLKEDPKLCESICPSIIDITQLKVVDPEEWESVYEGTGLIEALLSVLHFSPLDLSTPSTGVADRPHRLYVAPPAIRPSAAQLAHQAAAINALYAIVTLYPKVFGHLCSDSDALTSVVRLLGDKTAAWEQRIAAASLIGKVLEDGGANAQAALDAGAARSLLELIARDSYPYLVQDARDRREDVVNGLGAVAAHHADATIGDDDDEDGGGVVTPVVKGLWAIVLQVHQIFSSGRQGPVARHLAPALIAPLVSAASTSVAMLSSLRESEIQAHDTLVKMGVRERLDIAFLSAIKDPALYLALKTLRDKLSSS